MFTISVRLQTAALPTAVLAPCSTQCSNCTQWLWKNLQVSYLHSIKCNFFNCLRSWRCHQYQIGQLLQPDEEEEMSDFKIHINRTWRGYLVRDVDIKNKSPVSWFCFPLGSWLTDCTMPIGCKGTSSPSSHMKEMDSIKGSAIYLVNCLNRLYQKLRGGSSPPL